jgi:hypothetical protein
MTSYYTIFDITIEDTTDVEYEFLEDKVYAAADDCDAEIKRAGKDTNICARENGDPDVAAEVLQEFLKKFRAADYLYFTWVTYTSRLSPGDLGGGAYFITAEKIECMTIHEWLRNKVRAQKEKEQQNGS